MTKKLDEIYKPNTPDEGKFINMHFVKVYDYPVTSPNGAPFRADNIRSPGPQHKKPASQDSPEDAKNYHNANKNSYDTSIKEEQKENTSNKRNYDIGDIHDSIKLLHNEYRNKWKGDESNPYPSEESVVDHVKNETSHWPADQQNMAISDALMHHHEYVQHNDGVGKNALKLKSDLKEEALSQKEKDKKEDIVKGMKKNSSDLKKRYGDKWKNIMHATATKLAKEEVSQISKAIEKIITENLESVDIEFGSSPVRTIITFMKEDVEMINYAHDHLSKKEFGEIMDLLNSDNPNDYVDGLEKVYSLIEKN